MTNARYSPRPAGLAEKKLEWAVAITMILTALVFVGGAAAAVASVFFEWGAAA